MYIDRIIYPVNSLGPGNRLAIWTSGCNRACKNCANPELWEQHDFQKISPGKLAAQINRSKMAFDGITLTGGEPFYQAEELSEMIQALETKTEILVFSGYLYEELKEMESARALLALADVLIDGRYIDELNDNMSPLRGSVNQKIHFLNETVREKYETYMERGRQIQNFVYDYKTVSVGIHNRYIDQEM